MPHCIYISLFIVTYHTTNLYLCQCLTLWNFSPRQTVPDTQRPRGCQVIATKNMRLFYHENGLKPHVSV